MKALFFNELRKGRLLPLFGLALGVLVAVLRGFFGAYPPLISRSMLDDTDLYAIVLVASVIIAIIGGAGLFASEVERGTLPMLLALPITRKRIWAAKVLAGLTLALSATTLLVTPSTLALRHAFHDPTMIEGVVIFGLWWGVAFVAGVWCSTMLEHVASALMVAVVLCVGLVATTAAMVQVWGGSLIGIDSTVDALLWCAALTPGMFLGSLIALSRGELLRAKRKWLLGSAVFVVWSVTAIFVISAAMHWATRYDRTRVQWIEPMPMPLTGGFAAVNAYRDPVRWEMSSNGLRRRMKPDYRSTHAVLVDLKTRRDVLVRRGTALAAASADGRLAAVASEGLSLTWRADQNYRGMRRLEMRNLKTGSQLYRGWPRKFREQDGEAPQSLSWSPGATWVALQTGGSTDHLWAIRPDGDDATTIHLWPHSSSELDATPSLWGWAASGRAVYALDRGWLVEYSLPSMHKRKIRDLASDAALPPHCRWLTAEVSVSPNGRFVAVALVALRRDLSDGLTRAPQAIVFVSLVAADGKQSLCLSQTRLNHGFGHVYYAWSEDSGRLFYLVSSAYETDSRVWREGQAASSFVSLPASAGQWGVWDICTLPDNSFLIWAGGDALLLDHRDRVRPFPIAKVRRLSADYGLMGVDDRGRAIVYQWVTRGRDNLLAVDLANGKTTRLFP